MRALILGTVLVAGCQCLTPVDEDGGIVTDAGRTGGGGATGGGATGGSGGGATGGGATGGGATGGGATGGGMTGGGATGGGGGGGANDAGVCVTHFDCPGPPPAPPAQCVSTMGAWSCAFGRCVAECSNGRTCTSPDAGCIDCGAGVECLTPANCPMVTSIEIEFSTCGLPTGSLPAQSISSLPCTYIVFGPDGGVFGTFSYFGFNDLSANIPSLGGGCIGGQLPTGAIRHNVSCPDCTLIVMP